MELAQLFTMGLILPNLFSYFFHLAATVTTSFLFYCTFVTPNFLSREAESKKKNVNKMSSSTTELTAEAKELSPEEIARLQRAAAAEKRMKKNALPKTLSRPDKLLADPVSQKPVSKGANLTPPPLPSQSAPVSSIVVSATPQAGSKSTTAELRSSPSLNDEKTIAPSDSNPVLEAALNRMKRNQAKNHSQFSPQKEGLLREIYAILKKQGKEPDFGLPSMDVEALKRYRQSLFGGERS